MIQNNKKTILGVIGTIGAGKDTAAEHISKKLNIQVFQISQPLKDIAKERGIEPKRENLIRIGSDLVKEKGPAFLAELSFKKIDSNLGIITGIRVLEIIDWFRENTNFILLSISADPKIRFKRSIERGKLGEAETLEGFIINEQKENSPPNSQRLFECMKFADYTIENDGDLDSFYTKIDKFLEKFDLV